MNAKDLEYFKNILLEKRKEVFAKEDMLESVGASKNYREAETGNSKYANHLADLGSDTMITEHQSYFRAREKKYLQFLDAALQRIENGEYNLCLGCGKEIPKERLEFVPHTRYCVPCKSKSVSEVHASLN